jgi:hypothetical protein
MGEVKFMSLTSMRAASLAGVGVAERAAVAEGWVRLGGRHG